MIKRSDDMKWRYETEKKMKRMALTGFLIIVSVLPILLNFQTNPAKATDGYLIEQNGVNDVNSQKSLTKLSNGTLITIFAKIDDNGKQRIYFRKSNDGGHTWIDKIALSSSGIDARSPSLAIDSKDNIYVVWYEYFARTDSNFIVLAKYSSNAKNWYSPTNITSPYTVDAWEPSITVDGNDVVHVAASGANPQSGYYCVWYLKYDGSSWTIPAMITGGDNEYEYYMSVNAGVDGNNNLHIVFSASNEEYKPYYEQIFYMKYNRTWSKLLRAEALRVML